MANLHLIGNAHIDAAWLWKWQESFSEVLATFRSALDRLNEFPDLKFTAGSAVYYKWVEQVDPEMFAEIKERVKEGRWSIVGGWFLQPDCNIPDGESYARHSLIAQRYFKEKFGVTAKTGYNVDPFGHNASIPKIIKNSGMNNYVCMRPMPHQSGFDESLFSWESDDGSSVCTFRLPYTYHIDLSCMDTFEKIKEKAEKENMDYMAFYGVGNHGGGPTIKLLNEIQKMNLGDMCFSTTDEYFSKVEKSELPVIKGELQHDARGCYSAKTFIKNANRRSENNLIEAETFSFMAKELIGAEYPQGEINKAWENLLFNQFHDILCGCSIKQVYEDANYLYGETMSITEKAVNLAMQKIAWNIDTLNGETLPSYKVDEKDYGQWSMWLHEVLGTPIVVFNPHTWVVKQTVRIYGTAKKMTDCTGSEIPFQIVRGYHTNFGNKYDTVFTAEIPAMGYAVYRLFTEQESKVEFTNNLYADERTLENSRIKVQFSEETGDICKLFDKKTGEYIIDKPLKAIVLDETPCNTWGHDVDELGEITGVFGKPKFKIKEKGNTMASLRVTTEYNGSVLERTYTIYSESDYVDVKVKLNFNEKHRTIKFTFPLKNEDVTAKIPYGTITRKGYTGEEPCGSWFASGRLGVANDSKYAYDTKSDEVRMTILRTAIYGDHFCERDDFCEYMDIGEHEFSYRLFLYDTNARAERNAIELNAPLRTIKGSFHNGTLPLKNGFFACDNEDVVVSAVKKSEDGDEAIIRFCEMNGKSGEITFELFGKKVKSQIGHNEIKTFTGNGKILNLVEWEK